MTPIQAKSLPAMLANKDVKAQAKTGSGKTAAFGISLLHKMKADEYQTQSLVLCPTRELADQVSKELRRLARPYANTKILTLCGGKAFGPQLASLEHQPHIVVGTPGRLLKHIEKGSLMVDHIQTLVLDEADRMLDMGFLEDIQLIISKLPGQRQTLLFSATYPAEIENISKSIQHDPVEIKVESQHDSSVIKQVFFETQHAQKTNDLILLLQHYQPVSSVVFCNRKQQCQELCDELQKAGFSALALEGDMDQKDRDETLLRFTNRSISILIATDVAARGLDIKDLEIVFNYELSPDPEIYVHRIGRTGRAGKEGLALSLFAPSEIRKVQAIEEYQSSTAIFEEIPANSKLESSKSLKPAMLTLSINSGRKDKIRPGDILGALTASKQLTGDDIGKIDIFDYVSYVAIRRQLAGQAMQILSEGKVKGKNVKVRKF